MEHIGEYMVIKLSRKPTVMSTRYVLFLSFLLETMIILSSVCWQPDSIILCPILFGLQNQLL